MSEFLELLNSTSPARVIFYSVVGIICLIIVTNAIIDIIRVLIKEERYDI